ncbi:hypothetical protein MAR_007571, partial [Mya arenaria]
LYLHFHGILTRYDDADIYIVARGNRVTLPLKRQKADAAEQYSRRNCLRISGIPETLSQTDVKILDIVKGIDVDLPLDDKDRSHRLIKSAFFCICGCWWKTRSISSKGHHRQIRHVKSSKLKASSHAHVYINEDLTTKHSWICYHARCILKSKLVTCVWTDDGNILVRENSLTVRRPPLTRSTNSNVTLRPVAQLKEY